MCVCVACACACTFVCVGGDVMKEWNNTVLSSSHWVGFKCLVSSVYATVCTPKHLKKKNFPSFAHNLSLKEILLDCRERCLIILQYIRAYLWKRNGTVLVRSLYGSLVHVGGPVSKC